MDKLINDQYQKRIQFFENSTKAKEKLIQSENERLKLEFELDKLINSDESILRTKALKLKAYYTKLCQDEEKSFKRNQSILNDIQRVDSQFHQFESKLERLSNLKRECEVYLRTSYPKWVNDNRVLPPSNETNILNTQTIRPDQTGPITVLPSLSATLNNSQNNNNNNNLLNDSFDINTLLDKYKIKDSKDKLNDPVIENVLKNLVSSTLPQERNIELVQQHQQNQAEKILNQSVLSSLLKPAKDDLNETNDNLNNNEMNNFAAQQTNRMSMTAQSINLIREYEREIKRQDANVIENTLINTITSLTNKNNPNVEEDILASPRSVDGGNNNDDDEETTYNSRVSNNGPAAPEGYEIKRRNTLRQELNIQGLYNLLDYIELEVSRTIHPDNYYRQVEPHYKNKLDIIKLAIENKPLDEMDSTSVSMVILDQLPNVIKKHTTSKCLFTQDLMGLSVTDIDEETVEMHLTDKKDKEILQRLLRHLNIIKRFGSIETNYLASIFAPAFLGGATTYGQEKATKFLEKIINSFGLLSTPPPERLNDTAKSITESMNQELMLASNSKLKESSFYQEFIMNTSTKSKELRFSLDTKNIKNDYDDDDDDDDENDEIDAMVAPLAKSTNSSANNLKLLNNNNPQNVSSSNFLASKSPRGTGEYEFDFSQSSTSEKDKKSAASLKKLNELRSSASLGTNSKKPAHLRDLDSSDDNDSDDSNEFINMKSIKNSTQKSNVDNDFDFYD